MSFRISRTRAVAAGACTAALALGVLAPPAQAGNRQDIVGHDGGVLAECADGGQVSGPLDGSYSSHTRTDDEGNPLSMSLTMEYKMTWTLSTTGQSVHPHGTRHLVFDFVDGTVTDTGNYRTLTIAGECRVLKYAGRSVVDLATGETLFKSGPDMADIGVPEVDNDLICGVFGVDGA